MKTIIHIANDFLGSKVYRNLFASIDLKGYKQLVYTACQEDRYNSVDFINKVNYKVYVRPILSFYTRVNFAYKAQLVFKDIINIIDFNKVDRPIIHAHTWFSDGVIAYLLHEKYGIDYIVSVRSTDINVFYKYMIHLRNLGLKILECAKRVVFISPSLKSKFFKQIKNQSIRDKCTIIVNGVDSFWIDRTIENINKIKNSPTINCLYIGTFIRRKNIIRLMKAIIDLNKINVKIHLHLIGTKGSQKKQMKYLTEKHSSYFTYYGQINDNNKILKIMRKCDIFTMVSYNETFGLVYIEALSQGLKLLYSKNDGIDGLYPNVGLSANPKDKRNIKDTLIELISKLDEFEFSPKEIVDKHNWENIARLYINKMYKI